MQESISSRVFIRLTENRREERAIALSAPIWRRTLEGSSAPEEHAEPWLTAMPAISRCMRSVSPSIPENARFDVFAMRGPDPLTLISGSSRMRESSRRSRRSCICCVISTLFFSEYLNRLRHSENAAKIFGAGAPLEFLPAASKKWRQFQARAGNGASNSLGRMEFMAAESNRADSEGQRQQFFPDKGDGVQDEGDFAAYWRWQRFFRYRFLPPFHYWQPRGRWHSCFLKWPLRCARAREPPGIDGQIGDGKARPFQGLHGSIDGRMLDPSRDEVPFRAASENAADDDDSGFRSLPM